MLQLHLSDQQFYCLLSLVLSVWRFKKTLSALLALCEWNPKCPVMRIRGILLYQPKIFWTNSQVAGDLRCFSYHGTYIYCILKLYPRWPHHMERISASLALYEENPPITGEFLSQRASIEGFWLFWRWPNRAVEKTFAWPVIWDAM